MGQARNQLLNPSDPLRFCELESETRSVPPDDIITVFETSPFFLGEEVAEGGIAYCHGLKVSIKRYWSKLRMRRKEYPDGPK